MRSHNNWLHQQLNSWLGSDLITSQQADTLRSRYPLEKESHWGSMVVPTLGSIIFALGVILFFAYNWSDMPKYIKLLIIIVSVGVSHAAAVYLCKGEKSNAYSESLHALGTMLFGAGIILIAQIYHIDDYYPNAIILLAIAAMLLAWARASVIQALMATILVTAWAATEIFDFYTANHISILIISIGILPFALYIRSAALMFFVSAALMFCYGFNLAHLENRLLFQGLFFLSCIYLLGGLLIKDNTLAKCASTIRFNGLLVYYSLMFIISFKYSLGYLRHFNATPDNMIEWLYYALPFIGLLVILVVSLYKTPWRNSSDLRKYELVLVCVSLTIVTYLGLIYPALERPVVMNWIPKILINITLAGHFLILIIEGTIDTKWTKTTVGSVLFAILVFARFTDLFHSLLWRSAAFLLLGAGLFVVGHYYNARKKQMVEAGS